MVLGPELAQEQELAKGLACTIVLAGTGAELAQGLFGCQRALRYSGSKKGARGKTQLDSTNDYDHDSDEDGTLERNHHHHHHHHLAPFSFHNNIRYTIHENTVVCSYLDCTILE
jgi:ABC-type nickel/cobalt efflux system permease component RcnA